jgi:hypothetical protein
MGNGELVYGVKISKKSFRILFEKICERLPITYDNNDKYKNDINDTDDYVDDNYDKGNEEHYIDNIDYINKKLKNILGLESTLFMRNGACCFVDKKHPYFFGISLSNCLEKGESCIEITTSKNSKDEIVLLDINTKNTIDSAVKKLFGEEEIYNCKLYLMSSNCDRCT